MIEICQNKSNEEQDFSDVEQFIKRCKYKNCTHQNNPGCALSMALINGELSEERLKAYLKYLRTDIYENNKKKYNGEWNKFTKNLSLNSKKKSANEKSEIDILEKETTQAQEELDWNMEDRD